MDRDNVSKNLSKTQAKVWERLNAKPTSLADKEIEMIRRYIKSDEVLQSAKMTLDIELLLADRNKN